MNADAGTLFGRYRLLRPLASDAVSTTYFATSDSGSARGRSGAGHFAVRIAERVDPTDGEAVEAARRYLSQAQQAGVIDHPTVVRPHDLGIIDGRPYVATPFVRAVPLGELLAHSGTINHSAALAMFAQLAGALDAAHRAGMVHGALSPQTIWVGPSAGEGVAYVAYLTGFGTATLLRDRMSAEPRGAPVDDILYVAPEQLRGEPVTGAADQYSLACAVFHTLAGHPPFERETRSKLYGAHLLAPAPALEADGIPVAPVTGAALLRAMSKEPDERYPTCGELIHEALPAGAPSTARSPLVGRRPRSRPGRAGAAGGGRRWWPVALAGILLLAAVAVLWAVVQPDGDRRDATTDDATEGVGAPVARPVTEEPVTAAATTERLISWDVEVAQRPVARIDVIGDGVVAVDRRGATLVDPADGTVRWRHDTGDADQVMVDGGVVAYSGDGLTAVDLGTGEARWTTAERVPTRSLTATGDVIVGVAGDGPAPEVIAVDGADGQELWHIHAEGDGTVPDVIAVAIDGGAYLLHGTTLGAIHGGGAQETAAGRHQVAGLTWETELDAPWPLVAPGNGFVAVATTDGRVCRHARDDGGRQWCEPVPGVGDEQPRLLTQGSALVVATSEAVVALDPDSGGTLWSRSPGSPGNVVAAGRGRVLVGDDEGVQVLDVGTGDVELELVDLGEVTALAVEGGTLYAGTSDGGLVALDVASGG